MRPTPQPNGALTWKSCRDQPIDALGLLACPLRPAGEQGKLYRPRVDAWIAKFGKGDRRRFPRETLRKPGFSGSGSTQHDEQIGACQSVRCSDSRTVLVG